MPAYPIEYLNDVVENQGKLFDMVSLDYPDKNTEDFIFSYMTSKTRAAIDRSQAYVNTMDAKELLDYFVETEHYEFKQGKAMEGFMPAWIGQFYAYYQWFYDVPSCEVVKCIPLNYLKQVYPGLHDLELSLAVEKVGNVK